MSQANEFVCEVKLFDHKDYQGQVTIRWSHELSTKFELKGTDSWLTSGPIKLPAEVKEFQIDGTVAWKHYRTGAQKSSGSSKLRFVDFTPAISPLRSQESWGKRMDKLVKELILLEKKYEDGAEMPSEWFKSNTPVARAAIDTAEQRLKFALPAEHQQLLQDFGAWRYSDSFCVSIEDIDRADKQMRSIWGSPASEFDSLSDKNKALYQASAMLFVEAGDGYGALIYHPNSSGGEYYWVHQDNLDDPDRLVDSQGKPRDYSSTMRWLIANQMLMYYDDAIADFTFIDRSSTTALPYQLRLDFPTSKPLEVKLEVDWPKFE